MPEPQRLDTRTGYDRWSQIYDDEGNPLVQLDEPLVRAWVGDPRGLRVADVGCGTGRHSVWLAEHGAAVDAFDGSPGMLARARTRDRAAARNIRFVEHTLPAPLPTADETYDLVLLALVADHIADLAGTLRDLWRVLKPGGRLILTTLHPAMNLRGITARFTDPDTGHEVRVDAFEHTYAAYVMSAIRAGFTLAALEEREADAELAKVTPRAEKYLGWPLLLGMLLLR